MVSEDSALVRVDARPVPAGRAVKIELAGADVTGQLAPAADGSLQGVLTGLRPGRSLLTASVGGTSSSLELVNHRNGPIISGPHQKPWICQTADFALPDGSKLGEPQDVHCNAPTRVVYMYRTTAATFRALPSTGALPPDLRTTTTSDGRTVNYIVRVETGTINRAIYQIAMLHDPMSAPAAGAGARQPGWNGKLVYTFGGSATAGYVQGLSTGGVLNDLMLSQGFAVASSSLNVFGNNENDVLSAETLSMVKEKFIKAHGVPLYTMGWGGSGGAMQQHLIAGNYPGLLDGITPSQSWSDLLTVVPTSTDCPLLSRAFAGGTQAWSQAQKTAVSGYRDYSTCTGVELQVPGYLSWEQTFSPFWLLARRGTPVVLNNGALDLTNCLLGLPAALVWDPAANRAGARCDVYSSLVNLLGVEPTTGYAARAIDNVGANTA